MRLATRTCLLVSVAFAVPLAPSRMLAAPAAKPNIVYILADDFGWGDTTVNNPASKIPTPHLDRLASQGIRFTNAHAPSAVCTPTRYGIMTGRYPFRNPNRGLLLANSGLGPESPPLIPQERLTVAEFLQQHGYAADLVGKWHLGWNWEGLPKNETWEKLLDYTPPAPADGAPRKGKHTCDPFDFRRPLRNGPLTQGFDTYFGINMPSHPPFAFIEGDRVTSELTRYRPYERFGAETPGPAAADWSDEAIMPRLAQRAVQVIQNRAREKKPFFLFFSMTSPHYPIAPTAAFRGKSGLNDVADFIMETDAWAGQILDALDASGLADDTLVIFTTDNGHDGTGGKIKELAAAGHKVSGPYSGQKWQILEGGHRIPFVARWPGVVPAGTQSDDPISLASLFATCADILGASLPPDAAEDSFSILPALRSPKPAAPTHPYLISSSGGGQLSLQRGSWKYTPEVHFGPPGPSGTGNSAGHELYNLDDDPAEKKNVIAQNSEKFAELRALLEEAIGNGRSRPGPAAKNDNPTQLRPAGVSAPAK